MADFRSQVSLNFTQLGPFRTSEHGSSRFVLTGVVNTDHKLAASSIVKLWQFDHEYSIFKCRLCTADVYCPAQWNDSVELAVTPFGAHVRDYPTSRRSAFLFSPDSEFCIAQTNLNLITGYSWEFYAEHYRVLSFSYIDRRSPSS